jgi:crotonobetainyl-CoA:carnitine CoA-transferase CaiB-like acyl-CoA transferase
MQPLAGIKVLDFSTLLPGPLASLPLNSFRAMNWTLSGAQRRSTRAATRAADHRPRSPIETSGYPRKLDLWRGQSSSNASL